MYLLSVNLEYKAVPGTRRELPKVSESEKDVADQFNRLSKGEQETLALTTNTYIAKDKEGLWNVYTVGAGGAPVPRFESGVSDVYSLIDVLPGNYNKKNIRGLLPKRNQTFNSGK